MFQELAIPAEKKTRPENRLRVFADAIIGVGVGAVASLFYYYGAPFAVLSLSAIAASSIIYFAALFTNRACGLAALLCFNVASFYFAQQFPDTLRITLFALVLLSSGLRLLRIQPFYVLGILWSVVIAIALASPATLRAMFSGSIPQMGFQAGGEIFMVVIFGLFAFSRICERLTPRTPLVVCLENYLPHAIALTLWGTSALALIMIGALEPQWLTQELLSSNALSFSVIAFIAILALVPIVGSRLIYLQLEDSLRFLVYGGSSSQARKSYLKRRRPLREFVEAYEFLNGKAHSQQPEALTTGRAPLGKVIAPQNEQELINLLNEMPSGVIACKADGSILALNRMLRTLCRIPAKELYQSVYDIHGDHPWAEELLSKIMAVLNDAPIRSEAKPSYSTSSVQNEVALEVNVRPLYEPHPSEVGVEEFSGVILVARQTNALNDFQLRLLAPSSLELTGSQAIERCKDFRSECHKIISELSEASKKVTEIQSPAVSTPERNEKTLELTVHHRRITAFAEQAEKNIQSIIGELNVEPTERNDVNFFELIETAICYLNQVSPGTSPLHLTVDRESLSENAADGELTAGQLSIVLNVPGSYLNSFLHSLLSLLRFMHQQASQIEINAGAEEISTGAAAIIPGSYPGRYARIMLSHSGQSFKATAGLKTSAAFSNLDSIDTALHLLTANTRRMGGFTTIQSSSSKGTTVTVYLPINPNSSRSRQTVTDSPRGAEEQQLSPETIANNVLLVGSDGETLAKITKMLEPFGYEISVRRPDVLLDEFNRPIGFDGSGFWGTFEDDVELAATPQEIEKAPENNQENLALDLKPFGILLYNVENSNAITKTLLRQLMSHNPEAKTVVVIDPIADDQESYKDWTTLERPFDAKKLTAAITRAKTG